jgi:hypothetical protein
MRRQTIEIDLLAIARAAGTIGNASPVPRFLIDDATLAPETAMVRS